MNEQITSAAELDALPAGSVVGWEGFATYIFVKTLIGAWVGAGSARPWSSEELLTHMPAVLYRPDHPQRVQPSRENVARLLAHQNADWLHGYLGADPATGGTHDHGPRCSNWEPYVEDADAVLALFAQQPTVAEVKAEALRDAADDMESTALTVVMVSSGSMAAGFLRSRADRIEREARA